jgi:hypothetical protein
MTTQTSRVDTPQWKSQSLAVHVVHVTTSLNCGHQQTHCSSHRRYMSMESRGGITLTEKNRKTRRKPPSRATLSTTNPIWTDPGVKQCLRCERPTTNRLSHWSVLRFETWAHRPRTKQRQVAGGHCSCLHCGLQTWSAQQPTFGRETNTRKLTGLQLGSTCFSLMVKYIRWERYPINIKKTVMYSVSKTQTHFESL